MHIFDDDDAYFWSTTKQKNHENGSKPPYLLLLNNYSASVHTNWPIQFLLRVQVLYNHKIRYRILFRAFSFEVEAN